MNSRTLSGLAAGVLLFVCTHPRVAAAQAAPAHSTVALNAHPSDSTARALALPGRSSLPGSIATHGEHSSVRLAVEPAPSPIADNSFLIE